MRIQIPGPRELFLHRPPSEGRLTSPRGKRLLITASGTCSAYASRMESRWEERVRVDPGRVLWSDTVATSRNLTRSAGESQL